MKILVLGASGLLGSTLCKLYKDQVTPVYRSECDLTDERQIKNLIYSHDPEIVINCAGDINRSPDISEQMYLVNSIAPHLLGKYAKRLVHISTDCVFSGNVGGYDELDDPNGRGHYAISKRLGEVRSSNNLTIRTSFVGYPDPKGNGLLAWLSKQKECLGYSRVFWNGLTTVELSHMIMKLANTDKQGILHCFGIESFSKYQLLCTVRDVYGWDIDIVPDDKIICDKTLKTVYIDRENVSSKTFKEMVEEMKDVCI